MSPIRMSKVESAIRVALEYNGAFNRHDVAGMMKLLSDECVLETAGPAPDGTVRSGKGAIRKYWSSFFRDSPDAHAEIEEATGMGAYCVLRWRYVRGQKTGGKEYVRGVDIFRVRSNLICEVFSYVKGDL